MSWVGPEFWISNKHPNDTDAIGPWAILNSKDLYYQDLQLNSLRLNSDFNETGSLLSVREFALARLDRGLVVIQPPSSGWNHDMGKIAGFNERAFKGFWSPAETHRAWLFNPSHFRLPESTLSLCFHQLELAFYYLQSKFLTKIII